MKGIGMNKFSGISVAVALLAAATLAGCPLVPTVDLQTQNFAAAGDAATSLEGKQLYFMPDSSESFYSRTVVDNITALPVSTATHTAVDFGVADPAVVTLPAGSEINFYGTSYGTIYIHSNGTVALEAGAAANGTASGHFSLKQISLLPVDATTAGSAVSYQVAANAVTVTFENVGGSSFQGEFFISGATEDDIALSYPTIDAAVAAGVVGFSRGQLAGLTQEEIDLFFANEFVGTGSDLGTTNTSSAKLGF